MKQLIDWVNELQDVFTTLSVSADQIELPQIVMVGSQSSGKSSVLESIVRRPFLPRGTGIVTRCPLILQLIRCAIVNDGDQVEEWGEFLHKKGEKFTDFDEIREEIENRTVALAGANKGIVEDPINLKIYSSKVVNLTLVDLPGITKVPVGDQPEDIEEQIRSLLLKYITNPKSIILAVSPANSDIANSDSLKLAQSKDVDPNGSRTLAVLTKLDLMDLGTDAHDILRGEVIPVKLGIIGVVLRSQQDIINNKSIDEQLASEDRFLKTNYSKVAKFHGVPYLEQTLSELLVHHIKAWIPTLQDEIFEKRITNLRILESCGSAVEDHDQFLSTIINSFVQDFRDTIDGTTARVMRENVVGGPIFRSIFDDMFEGDINVIEADVTKSSIIKDIAHVGGPRPFVFAPEMLFHALIKEHIERLRHPSIKCVDRINQEMDKLIKQRVKLQIELKRFPVLMNKVVEIMTKLLHHRMIITKKWIDNVINVELTSINTNHPHFSIENALKAFEIQNDHFSEGAKEAKETTFKEEKVAKDAEAIYALVQNYFNIVKINIKDLIPKTIIYTLINHMRNESYVELSSTLFKEKEELLAESQANVRMREDAIEMLQALETTQDVLNKIL